MVNLNKYCGIENEFPNYILFFSNVYSLECFIRENKAPENIRMFVIQVLDNYLDKRGVIKITYTDNETNYYAYEDGVIYAYILSKWIELKNPERTVKACFNLFSQHKDLEKLKEEVYESENKEKLVSYYLKDKYSNFGDTITLNFNTIKDVYHFISLNNHYPYEIKQKELESSNICKIHEEKLLLLKKHYNIN